MQVFQTQYSLSVFHLPYCNFRWVNTPFFIPIKSDKISCMVSVLALISQLGSHQPLYGLVKHTHEGT
jgi:hypothetical protein